VHEVKKHDDNASSMIKLKFIFPPLNQWKSISGKLHQIFSAMNGINENSISQFYEEAASRAHSIYVGSVLRLFGDFGTRKGGALHPAFSLILQLRRENQN
jgi:hypothetical protein